MRAEDLTGKKFGSLTAMKRAGSDRWGRATWHCRCECGTNNVVTANNLKERLVTSCGCSRRRARW